MNDIDWSKALKGWEVKFSHDGPGARWFVSKPSGYCNVVTRREVDNHVVSDLLDSMARAPIATPTESSTWTGSGLPPVGAVCEFAGGAECADDPFDKDLKVGMQVKIIAHFKDGELLLAAFTFDPCNPNRGKATVEQGAQGCFRPIRTPEQIAEEERKAAIAEINEVLGFGPAHDAGERLYLAGYRKQEAV
ncbi:hypothetical protein [Pseudomonas tohonis]|uniref:hypothetical protein n=1 Tax=Pseudomonas tohonis TaxID=2725477 RepID=UPI001F248065|nr:hypothetical protein [Pseudomonas tohonis]